MAAIFAVLLGTTAFSAWLGASQLPGGLRDAPIEDLQVVCSAQGHLQLLAKYPSDPITAFELLGLDPHERPFSPSDNSRWYKDKWHQDVLETVDRQYTELLDGTNKWDDDDAGHREKYKTALTAAADMLSRDGPRRLYVSWVLPVLEDLRGKKQRDARCVWPRVRDFHRRLCAASWPATGMLGLLREGREMAPECFGAFRYVIW